MLLIFNLFIFIFGLCLGSLLNCIIYRLEQDKSFVFGRSYCPKCKHQLAAKDLIPVLSFIMLKGKCRYCQEKISWQYPLVEIITGALFLLIFNFYFPFQRLLEFIYLLITSCFLIIIFIYDLKHYVIPDKIIYPAIAAALIFNFQFLIFNQFTIFEASILSAFLASAFFAAIVILSQGKWMGVGDIKLAFFMGLFLGFPNILVALFLAFTIGAIIGMILVILKKKQLKSEIPFGPFLITATFLAMFWGSQIINWYLSLFKLNI